MNAAQQTEADSPDPAPLRCEVCGKALGTRRGQQGVRVHPRCRRSGLDRVGLEQALQHTEEALERLGSRGEDGEIGALFEQASQHARGLVSDLRRMRDFMQPVHPRQKTLPSGDEARDEAGPETEPSAPTPRQRWGTPTTPAWALLGEPAPPEPPVSAEEAEASSEVEPDRGRPTKRRAASRKRGGRARRRR